MREDIVFGPGGWQGRLDEDITEENILLVAHAFIRYLFELHPSSLRITTAIGFDGRSNSKEIALLIAKTFSENGIDVLLSSGIIPTPVLSFAVLANGCAAGIMVTGGDLPSEYNGIEFKGAYGGPLTTDVMAQIGSLLLEKVRGLIELSGTGKKEIVTVDFLPGYVTRLESLIDFPTLRSFAENPKNNASVLIDSMGGTGQTIIEDILVGCGWRAQTLFGTPEKRFFDRCPESAPANLDALKYNVKVVGALLGVATDGGGSRCGIIDQNGEWLNAQEATLVLLWHLHEHKGWKGRVLKSAFTTDKVLRAAADLNIPLTDFGLQFGIDEFIKEKTLLGCFGGGAYCCGSHLPECDGILTGLLFAEMIARMTKSLDEIKEGVQRSFGSVYYSVIDRRFDTSVAQRLIQTVREFPTHHLALLGKYQLEIDKTGEIFNGLKLRWGDCRWLIVQLLPFKGVIRLHIEGESDTDLSIILEACEKYLLPQRFS